MEVRWGRQPAQNAAMTDPDNARTYRFRDILSSRADASRYAAILGLQMGQALPVSFIGLMLPMVFREQGLPLAQMFVFSLPSIPVWLRPLWAPFVDRTGSRKFGMRKTWFVPCTLMAAAAYLAMSMVAPELESLHLMIMLLVVANTIITTQDIAIDGYMVENIQDRERPVAGAVLDIARNTGMFISWAGLGLVYREFGWTAATGSAAVLLILFSLPGMLRREPVRAAQQFGPPPSLKRLFGRSDNRVILPTCFAIALFASLLPYLYPTFLIDVGFSAGDVAIIAGPATLLGTLFGATLASLLLRRFGYRATFLMGAVSVVLAVFPIVWLANHPDPKAWMVFLVTLQGLALPSLFDVTFQAARLKWASKAQPATDYTAQLVAMRAGASLAVAVGGVLAAAVGWPVYFIITGICVSGVCLAMYFAYDRIEMLVDDRAAQEQREVESNRLAAQVG